MGQGKTYLGSASRAVDAIVGGWKVSGVLTHTSGAILRFGKMSYDGGRRALIVDPRILILDDATSSVDAITEREIRDALEEVMEDRTTIIIAHRTSTLTLADKVLLLDDGRVIASGTHERLLVESARYRQVLAETMTEPSS